MTNIEIETLNAVKSASRRYIANSTNIDWEKRRYEIAKDCLASMCANPTISLSASSYVKNAVEIADALIKELENQ